MKTKRLVSSFFLQPTKKIALSLLGKYLVRKKSDTDFCIGKIVETEMYYGISDKACHASHRKKETCKSLWGEAGHLYAYLTYGIYWMLNIVTEEEGFPAAVLIRAVEPLIECCTFKQKALTRKELGDLRKMGAGPGKLTRWMKIDKSFDGEDLNTSQRIWIEDRGEKIKQTDIIKTTRIGVDYAGSWKLKPWRFYLKNSLLVSKK